MMMLRVLCLAALVLAFAGHADASDLAAGDTLRAVYIDSNLAQARRDPASGEVKYEPSWPVMPVMSAFFMVS